MSKYAFNRYLIIMLLAISVLPALKIMAQEPTDKNPAPEAVAKETPKLEAANGTDNDTAATAPSNESPKPEAPGESAGRPGITTEIAMKEAPKPAPIKEDSFMDIIKGSGALGVVIWILLFLSSAVGLCLIIDALLTVRMHKIVPRHLVLKVHESLNQGDLAKAIDNCKAHPSPLSRVLLAGFNNLAHGFDAVSESIVKEIEMEDEKLMQRINYLNLCGSLAPMLGLLGTVTGMVSAFYAIGTTTGAEKAKLLAIAIAQALYTTAVGLFIAVPVIIAFTMIRNNANRIIISLEGAAEDVLKIIRNAEIEK